MLWIVLAVLLVLAALAGLGLALFGVYQRVRSLLRELGRAGDAVGPAVEALAALQPGGDGPREPDMPPSPARRP